MRSSRAARGPKPVATEDPRVAAARTTVLEGVGAEVAASFPGITRIGGQIVAALYLAEARPRAEELRGATLDELVEEIGYAKSNVFQNMRSLEASGIVQRRRVGGRRSDRWVLAGPYPDVMVGAYLMRLRKMVGDKQVLAAKTLAMLGDAPGEEAAAMRAQLGELARKYAIFGELFRRFEGVIEGPIDLEPLLTAFPEPVLGALFELLRGR